MSGNPVETGDASLRLAVNCDIATPMERPGDGVDAFLDVLVRADGSSFVVHDRDAFEQGLQRGLLLRAEHQGGLREDQVEVVENGKLLAWLNELAAVRSCQPPEAAAMERGPIPVQLRPRRIAMACTRHTASDG